MQKICQVQKRPPRLPITGSFEHIVKCNFIQIIDEGSLLILCSETPRYTSLSEVTSPEAIPFTDNAITCGTVLTAKHQQFGTKIVLMTLE